MGLCLQPYLTSHSQPQPQRTEGRSWLLRRLCMTTYSWYKRSFPVHLWAANNFICCLQGVSSHEIQCLFCVQRVTSFTCLHCLLTCLYKLQRERGKSLEFYIVEQQIDEGGENGDPETGTATVTGGERQRNMQSSDKLYWKWHRISSHG